MTPKPIVVITYSRELDENMSRHAETARFLEQKLYDYHVFFIPSLVTDHDIPYFELQVFYEKDFTPIQYEELKKMILDSLPKKAEQ